MTARTVVFDLDGVLLRGDSTVDFLRQRLRRAPWLLPTTAIAGAGFALSDRNAPSRTAWSRRVIASLGLGRRVDAVTAELQELARASYADAERVPQRTVGALRDHVASGDRVLVSSAGLEPFVRTWVSLLCACDPDAAQVSIAASTLRQRPWGVEMDDHHYGRRKLERARELGFTTPFDVVYSDSDTDLPLLENARRPVLVNPSDQALRALPAAVLERSDVWAA